MSGNVGYSVKAGIIGGLIGFGAGFLVNYFLLPVPDTEMFNAIGNGISGLLSGFMGGFMGLLVHLKKEKKG